MPKASSIWALRRCEVRFWSELKFELKFELGDLAQIEDDQKEEIVYQLKSNSLNLFRTGVQKLGAKIQLRFGTEE